MNTVESTQREPRNQAEHVIRKFGGARALSRALALSDNPADHRSPSVIFRWTYAKAKGGTGGLIPSSAVEAVKRAGRLVGVLVTPHDLYGGS